MLLAGDEFGNSQGGNNNVYAQDNETGWVDWSGLQEDPAFHEQVRLLVRLRRDCPLLKLAEYPHAEHQVRPGWPDILWLSPSGRRLHDAEWAHCHAFTLLLADRSPAGPDTRITALAVLLPVVAGQSGNAGAQALAVTMRGLALREVTVRQWLNVTVKEVSVGLANGIGIAITCGLGVYLWSGSAGLVAVIALSMVLAMVVAGFAGAVVPMVLTRLGQDPAQASSIVLTTVTDVAGFFSFLGIATLLSTLL